MLEDPLITSLFDLLVIKGDFLSSEKVLRKFESNEMFSDFLKRNPFKAHWKKVSDFSEHIDSSNAKYFEEEEEKSSSPRRTEPARRPMRR